MKRCRARVFDDMICRPGKDTVMRFPIKFCTALVFAYSCVATGAKTVDAATVYRCVGMHGVVAFQDHACLADGKQTVLDIISHDPPVSVIVATNKKAEESARPRQMSYSRPRAVQPTSWECRTPTGMVFYRHSRCPASLVDGTDSSGRSRRVMVSSQGMDRREACRRMRNGARNGSQFDDKLSTYERNLGRDTCRNY